MTGSGGGGRLRDLRRAVGDLGLVEYAAPMEAVAGWPLPRMDAGRVCVALPLIGVTAPTTPNSTATLHPPLALVTFAWAGLGRECAGARIITYTDLRWDPPVPDRAGALPLGAFPHDEARAAFPTTAEYEAAADEALALVEALLDRLGTGGDLTPAEEARLRELLGILVEPCLLPDYRALAPRFADRFLPNGSP